MDPNPLKPRVRTALEPGDIGAIVSLHGSLYAAERGWDYTFEAYVAEPLGAFARSFTDRERIWIVDVGGEVRGSIAIVDAGEDRAQLRWLLLHPELRGLGMGRRLVDEAVGFCRSAGYRSVFLWTEKSLEAAARLYDSAGFSLTDENTHELWGAVVTEQRYERSL